MPAGPEDLALPGLTRAEVAARAAGTGLAHGARLLTTRDWTSPEDWIRTVLAPVAVGGSLVVVRNTSDDTVLERRLTQERATVRD
jgi:hypothetical protein